LNTKYTNKNKSTQYTIKTLEQNNPVVIAQYKTGWQKGTQKQNCNHLTANTVHKSRQTNLLLQFYSELIRILPY